MKTVLQDLREACTRERDQLELLNGSSIYAKANKQHNEILAMCKERGKADGELCIPQGEQFSLFEESLKPRYQNLLEETSGRSGHLLSRIQARKDQVEEALKATRLGQLNQEISQIEQHFKRLCIIYDRIDEGTNASKIFLRLKYKGWLYCLLIVPFTLEAGYNILVIEPLDIKGVAAVFVAIMMAVFITVLAHFTGISIRRKKNLIASILGVVLSIVAFIFAFLRAAYTISVSNGAPQNWNKLSFESVVFSAHFGFALIVMMMMIITWSLISYFAHDTEASFEEVYCDFHFKLPLLKKEYAQLMEKEKRIQSVQHKDNSAPAYLEEAAELNGMFGKISTGRAAWGKYVMLLCREAILTYRMENEATREKLGISEPVPYLWSYMPDVTWEDDEDVRA